MTLYSKFARRSKNQNTSGCRPFVAVEKAFKDRKKERSCLSRAGDCRSANIAALQGNGNGLSLDWRRANVAEIRGSFEERTREVEFDESVYWDVDFRPGEKG